MLRVLLGGSCLLAPPVNAPAAALRQPKQPSIVVASEPKLTQYVHTLWRTEEGLPQNSGHAPLQARDGYMRIGTEEGLVRFNGTQFTTFSKANVAEMQGSGISALYEDQEGTLWVGTFGRGLYSVSAGAFTAHGEREGLDNRFICALAQDLQGWIWVGAEGGLYQGKNGRFVRYMTADGLPSNYGLSLTENESGTVWTGTTLGLVPRASRELMVACRPRFSIPLAANWPPAKCTISADDRLQFLPVRRYGSRTWSDSSLQLSGTTWKYLAEIGN